MIRVLVLLSAFCFSSTALAENCKQAQANLDEGLVLEQDGRPSEALEHFRSALEQCPEQVPDARHHVRRLEDQLYSTPSVEPVETTQIRQPAPEPVELTPLELARRGEEPAVSARVELAVVQGLHGLALSGLLCQAPRNCVSTEANVLAGLAGVGLGSGLALLATWKGIQPGVAMAINSGSLWGLANGLMLSSACNLFSFSRTTWPNPYLMTAVLGGAGTGLGILLGTWLQPTSGQMAMTNSGALWGFAISTMITMSVNPYNQIVNYPAMIAATNLGLVGMAVLSKFAPVSRLRMLLIDAGGASGMLTGFLLGTALGGGRPGLNAIFGTIGVGTGLILAALWSRPLDAVEHVRPGGVEVVVAPVGPQGTPGLSAMLGF